MLTNGRPALSTLISTKELETAASAIETRITAMNLADKHAAEKILAGHLLAALKAAGSQLDLAEDGPATYVALSEGRVPLTLTEQADEAERNAEGDLWWEAHGRDVLDGAAGS